MIEIGIYKIECASTGRLYVGSSVWLRKRWMKHARELRQGIHHNSKLQRAWSKYGEGAFTCMTLELCAREDLIVREQHWMDELRAHADGFNLCAKAHSMHGVQKKHHSEATKAKIRAKRALQVVNVHSMHESNRGRPCSQATRDKISAGHKARRSNHGDAT